MHIESTGTATHQMLKSSESVDSGRKELEEAQPDAASSSQNKVQPEEILTQIKSLTEGGLYSVRFENSQEFDQMVVKVVNRETNEVIRQVPAEEVLGVKASLAELRGQLFEGTG